MVLAAVLLLLAACTGPARELAVGPVPSVTALPAGWRWESYGGIEVGVPAEFGYDNGSQRLGQWCVGQKRADAGSLPVVGRPRISTLAGCRESVDVADTGPVVSLERALGEAADGVTRRPDDRTAARCRGGRAGGGGTAGTDRGHGAGGRRR